MKPTHRGNTARWRTARSAFRYSYYLLRTTTAATTYYYYYYYSYSYSYSYCCTAVDGLLGLSARARHAQVQCVGVAVVVVRDEPLER